MASARPREIEAVPSPTGVRSTRRTELVAKRVPRSVQLGDFDLQRSRMGDGLIHTLELLQLAHSESGSLPSLSHADEFRYSRSWELQPATQSDSKSVS